MLQYLRAPHDMRRHWRLSMCALLLRSSPTLSLCLLGTFSILVFPSTTFDRTFASRNGQPVIMAKCSPTSGLAVRWCSSPIPPSSRRTSFTCRSEHAQRGRSAHRFPRKAAGSSLFHRGYPDGKSGIYDGRAEGRSGDDVHTELSAVGRGPSAA